MPITAMLFMGDATYEGGYEHVAKAASLDMVKVCEPEKTLSVIRGGGRRLHGLVNDFIHSAGLRPVDSASR